MSEAKTEPNKNEHNSNVLSCKYCNSKILAEQAGIYVCLEQKLPSLNQKATKNVDYDTETEFYQVSNVLDFWSVGICKSFDNLRYLICADCEIGPIGFHDPVTNKGYLAIDRVVQTPPP